MKPVLMAAYTNYRRDPRVRREAEALVQLHYRVVFLASLPPGEPQRESLNGVEVIKLKGVANSRTSAFGYIVDYLLFFFRLMLHMMWRPRRYGLIHINNMPDFLVFAAWLPRLLGVPVFHDVHDLMPELYEEKFGVSESSWIIRLLKAQERWAGRFANEVLTVEERLRTILGGRGIDRSKIHVLMNLPDDAVFQPRKSRPMRGDAEPVVLVYHGTLARRLGLDIAIEAVARVRPLVPNVRLRIIGAGEEREPLMRLTECLGLGNCVTFSDGFVPVEAVYDLISDADIGVIPLRASPATDVMLPTKLLEYVKVGIPCVVPKTTTIARYFDAEMVEFFEAENVESLASAITNLSRNPQRRAQLAEAATDRFGRSHTWKVHSRVYTDLVESYLPRPA